jgi:hypothetical protein
MVERAAVGVSRRGTFGLGLAGFLALGAAPVAKAKTSNSVKKKRARRAADRKCRQQVAQCQTSLVGLGAPPEIIACCEILRKCNLVGFFDCVTS